MARRKTKASATTEAGVAVIECEAHLEIAKAEALQHQLEDALGQDCALKLAAANVESADTACLQLICALRREMDSRGLGLEWDSPSEALCRAAQTLGLSEALALPKV